MKLLISILCLLMTPAAACFAQNGIDNLVENISTVGNSTFTSAVERDSKTHRIIKVVKKLSLEGTTSHKLRKAFEAEKHSGTFTEKCESNVRTLMLTTQDAKATRIYMLRMEDDDPYPKSETTIIVKLK